MAGQSQWRLIKSPNEVDSGLSTYGSIGGSPVQGGGGQQTQRPADYSGHRADTPSPAMMDPSAQYDQTQANNPQAVAQTTSFGGAYAAPVLSEGTHGFRQLQATGRQTSGYNPVDQSSGDYLGFQSSPDLGVPDVLPEPEREDNVGAGTQVQQDPGQGFSPYTGDTPAALENPDGSVSADRQRELGLHTSDTTNYNDNAAGRRLAAEDLGYKKGTSTGSTLGTLGGLAFGIPGLGILGGMVAGDTKGDLGTFDNQGNVYGEDGAKFNPITGEQETSFIDRINPFDDTPEYKSYGEGANLVPAASQGGIRSVAGDQSILDVLNEAENPAAPEVPGPYEGSLDAAEAYPDPALTWRGHQYGSQQELERAQTVHNQMIQNEIDWFEQQSNSPNIFKLSDGRRVFQGEVYDSLADAEMAKHGYISDEAKFEPFRQQIREDPSFAQYLRDNPQLMEANSAGAPPGITAGWVDADGDGYDDDGEAVGTHGMVNVQTAAGEAEIAALIGGATGGQRDDQGNKIGVHYEPGRGNVDYGSGTTRSDSGREGSGYGGQAKSGEWVSGDHDWSSARESSNDSSSSGGK